MISISILLSLSCLLALGAPILTVHVSYVLCSLHNSIRSWMTSLLPARKSSKHGC